MLGVPALQCDTSRLILLGFSNSRFPVPVDVVESLPQTLQQPPSSGPVPSVAPGRWRPPERVYLQNKVHNSGHNVVVSIKSAYKPSPSPRLQPSLVPLKAPALHLSGALGSRAIGSPWLWTTTSCFPFWCFLDKTYTHM